MSEEKIVSKTGRPFPRRTLEHALRVTEVIKEFNAGNPWVPEQIAKALRIAPKSANFYYITAASRDYGLTTGTRDTAQIKLTELGKRVMYPPEPRLLKQSRITAFLSVELFRKVLEYYKGNNLPDKPYITNVLQTTFNLDPAWHDEFIDIFAKNCKYLGIGNSFDVANPHANAGQSSVAADSAQPATITVASPKKNSSGKVCFVIMPFTERADNHPAGFFEESLKSLFTPAITDAGFEVRTALRSGSDIIQATIVNELLAADLVLADLTEHNPNVLFELGMRMAENKPVALVKAKGTGRIFDVDNMLRVQDYDPNLWKTSVEEDIPKLREHIKATWESRGNGTSFLDILKRQPPQA